jgi:hypothetical protein
LLKERAFERRVMGWQIENDVFGLSEERMGDGSAQKAAIGRLL